MADRGQIVGELLDGPLAFDNAIDPEAARIKGIRSEVAGTCADLGGAGSRSRQYAGEESHIPGQGGCSGACAGGAGARHFNVARRLGSHANGVLRSRGALGRRSPAHGGTAGSVIAMDAYCHVRL